MDLIKSLSKETLIKIIDYHINRYSALLKNISIAYHVNKSECEHYLTIWKQAKQDLKTETSLSKEVEYELYDYISSGETEFLTENEIVYFCEKGLI